MKRILPLILLAVVVSSCTAPTTVRRPAPSGGREPEIRVLLAEGVTSATVSASEGLTVSSGGMALLESPGKCTVRVKAEGRQIVVLLEPAGMTAVAEGEVSVEPQGNSVLAYDGLSYAGKIRALGGKGGKLFLVNALPLESYLEGVLPHEMGNPGADGYDALKAQAVAARTYAMEKVRTRANEAFDVYAGVQDQVYKGMSGRAGHASSAVRDTRGIVLERGGGLAKTYYSACCGGHTSDIRRVWPRREPADYLAGVPDRDAAYSGAFCRDYKAFRWRYSFTGKELGDMLRVTLPRRLGVDPSRVGSLTDVRITEWTPSGRVSSVEIETTRGVFTVVGDEIRWVLMADPKAGRILPSILFKFDKVMEGGRVAFLSIAGGGNGHGVGMCQHGAIGMSKRGYTYRMILVHYYPGCDMVKVYD